MTTGSWVAVPDGSDFPIENLPYGAFGRDGAAHLGVAIGDRILDLHAASESGLFDDVCAPAALRAGCLNPLLASGKDVWRALRSRLQSLLLRDGDPALRNLNGSRLFADRKTATMLVPVEVGDYVDFYSSEQHATNLGRIFRPNAEPLLPNWKWMPVGYHGRAGSIVIDGTPIRRPHGQCKPPDADVPLFAPSAMLDLELEIGFFTGGGNEIFGLVLVNDWSARDIQAWEYQPLGPFLGKSFGTTISPWVVTTEALAPFRVAPPPQDPPPLSYLHIENDAAYDVALAVDLQTAAMRAAQIAPVTISRTNARELYWTMAQQLTHATSNGATARPGDLFASGTISGSDPASYGSLIELTWRGTKPLRLPNGEMRSFLEDGDEIALRAWCERAGLRIGFGACRGRITGGYVETGASSQER
ncbi:MAG TPA: fumarylacetoacetase [Candidatus Tyrphobacter sp.]